MAARRRRGWSKVVDFKRIEACPEQSTAGRAWIEPLQALERLLQGPETTPGDATVVLSNHFVRYLLLPWNDQIGSREELGNYARACFESVFGAAAQAWDIRVAPDRLGAPRLACAVDRDLLAAVRESIGRSRLRLVSIQPYLMAAYNRLGRHFGRGDFLFALIEPGRACLLAATGRQWQAVRSVAANGGESVAAILERELRLLEANSAGLPQLFIHAPDCAALPLANAAHSPQPRFLVLAPLNGFEPERDSAFSMAMAA